MNIYLNLLINRIKIKNILNEILIDQYKKMKMKIEWKLVKPKVWLLFQIKQLKDYFKMIMIFKELRIIECKLYLKKQFLNKLIFKIKS